MTRRWTTEELNDLYHARMDSQDRWLSEHGRTRPLSSVSLTGPEAGAWVVKLLDNGGLVAKQYTVRDYERAKALAGKIAADRGLVLNDTAVPF